VNRSATWKQGLHRPSGTTHWARPWPKKTRSQACELSIVSPEYPEYPGFDGSSPRVWGTRSAVGCTPCWVRPCGATPHLTDSIPC
jgi:hypothetical protein